MEFLSTTVIGFLLFIFSILFFLAKLYRRCPSNRILVVYGRVGDNKASNATMAEALLYGL